MSMSMSAYDAPVGLGRGEISECLDRVGNATTEVELALASISNSLIPILRPDPTELAPADSPAPRPDYGVDLANALQALSDRLYTVSSQVQGLESRVAL